MQPVSLVDAISRGSNEMDSPLLQLLETAVREEYTDDVVLMLISRVAEVPDAPSALSPRLLARTLQLLLVHDPHDVNFQSRVRAYLAEFNRVCKWPPGKRKRSGGDIGALCESLDRLIRIWTFISEVGRKPFNASCCLAALNAGFEFDDDEHAMLYDYIEKPQDVETLKSMFPWPDFLKQLDYFLSQSLLGWD